MLFAGDNLFEDSYLFGGDESCNPERWLEVLNEYLTLNVETFISGHGQARDKTVVEETIAYLEKTKEAMKKLSKEGKSKEEVVKEVYKIEFYPYDENNEHDVMLKNMTLERFYDVWIDGKE